MTATEPPLPPDAAGPGHDALTIAAVERDTGLSKDTLRAWERRYGFPAPTRDAGGRRAYTREQVLQLRLIRRLLDAGHRAGAVVGLDIAALQHLADRGLPDRAPAAPDAPLVLEQLALIRGHDAAALAAALRRLLAERGALGFVDGVVAPLTFAVGEAWLQGRLQVFEEHQYSETVQRVLREAIAAAPAAPGAAPRVLLATLPGEPHGIGLLMAETVLAHRGADCVSLGTQAPLWEVLGAAQAYRADVVALSFTGCIDPNHVVAALAELRRRLAPTVGVWAGGSAPVLHRRRIDGVLPLADFDAVPGELQRWRAALSARAG